ncbi:MAG: PIN domain-containing protein [Myxococcota bacterium]
MLLDTSGLLAALAGDQRRHRESAAALLASEGPFVLSPFVLAELDYLLNKLAGIDAALRLLDEIAAGAYLLAPFASEDVARAREVVSKHRAAAIGLADASIVVLSEHYDCLDLLSLDERHFRALRGAGGKRFRLLPADG